MAKQLKNQLKNVAFSALFFAVMAGCGICDDDDFPELTTGLNTDTTPQQGGVKALSFLKKTAPLADEEDTADWAAAVTAGDMRIVNGCFGQGNVDDNSTVEELGACEVSVETVTKQTLTFEYIEDNATKDVHKFMKALKSKGNCYLVSMAFCDGRVTAFLPAAIIAKWSVDPQKSGKTKWTLEVTFTDVPEYLTITFDDIWAVVESIPQL